MSAPALVIIVVALLVLASVVSKIFGNVGGLNKDELGLNSSVIDRVGVATSAPAGSVVKPSKATVYSPDGEADYPGTAGQAIDGDPSTSWATDVYTDAVPFPGFKNGVGLMLQLPSPRSSARSPSTRQHRDQGRDPRVVHGDAASTRRHHAAGSGRRAQTRPQHHPGQIGIADVESAGVDLHVGHHERQEPGQHLGNHGPGRVLIRRS